MVNFSCHVHWLENVLKCISLQLTSNSNIFFMPQQYFKFLALMEAKSSIMFSILLFCISLHLSESHIWQTYEPVTILNNSFQFTNSFFPLISFNQSSSIKHFFLVSFSLESFMNFFKMSSHMDKLFKKLQLKWFWFQHNVCSVATNCEIGSWVYNSSMRPWKTSSSR